MASMDHGYSLPGDLSNIKRRRGITLCQITGHKLAIRSAQMILVSWLTGGIWERNGLTGY